MIGNAIRGIVWVETMAGLAGQTYPQFRACTIGSIVGPVTSASAFWVLRSVVILPLGTNRPKHRPTTVTYALILTNLLIYLGISLASRQDEAFDAWVRTHLVLTPGQSPWWTYLTYAFLHGNIAHVLFNMLALFVFGPDVEDRLGKIGFLALYLVGGVGAGVAHAQLSQSQVVGASGAIAAVIGAFLVFFPFVQIKTLIFFFIIGMFYLTAWWYIALTMFLDLIGFARSDSNVAYGAHLGGYAFGMLVAMVLLWLKVVPREPYDLFSLGRQAARRRAFKAAQAAGSAHRIAASPAGRSGAAQAGVDGGEPELHIVKPDTPAAKERLKVQQLIAEGKIDQAAAAYLHMRSLAGSSDLPPLGRQVLYEIANHLYLNEDYTNAADAYRELLVAYPTDPEAPRVLLMLGIIYARYLNDPTEAVRLLGKALEKLRSDEDKALAKELLTDLQ